MIGLSDFDDAYFRVIRKGEQPRRGDALALWAGMSTASNSGASVDNKDYAKGLSQAQSELYTQLEDGLDVDSDINWASKQGWVKKGLPAFEEWLVSRNKKASVLLEIGEVQKLLSVDASVKPSKSAINKILRDFGFVNIYMDKDNGGTRSARSGKGYPGPITGPMSATSRSHQMQGIVSGVVTKLAQELGGQIIYQSNYDGEIRFAGKRKDLELIFVWQSWPKNVPDSMYDSSYTRWWLVPSYL